MPRYIKILDQLLQSIPRADDGSPTDLQFALLQNLVDEIPITEICAAIYERYNPEIHDRHLLAMIFSMLIWHSSEHDLAVSDFMSGWLESDDPVKIGILISRCIEWFPFCTPEKTLEGSGWLANKFPEFKDDCKKHLKVQGGLLINFQSSKMTATFGMRWLWEKLFAKNHNKSMQRDARNNLLVNSLN